LGLADCSPGASQTSSIRRRQEIEARTGHPPRRALPGVVVAGDPLGGRDATLRQPGMELTPGVERSVDVGSGEPGLGVLAAPQARVDAL